MNYEIKIPKRYGVCFFLMGTFVTAQTTVPIKKDTIGKERTIEEVVLVGYGTQKKNTVSGATANVNTKLLQDRPIPSLITALQGTLPGVNIMQRPGDVGSDRGSLNIRGRGNLGSSSPLFVVDGVIVSSTDFAMLNSNDVENLTVLKDASAAIYGSRAAYGVVLVTTKKGSGGKIKVSYDGMSGYQIANYLPKMLGSVDYMLLRNEALTNAGKAKRFTDSEIDMARSGKYPDLFPNTDWYKLYYRQAAPMTEHTLNVSGGGKTRYYLSLGYFGQESLQPDKGLDRYTVRANTTSTVSDKLTFGSNFSFVREGIKSDAANISPNVALARMVPTMVPIQSNGNWGTVNGGQLDATLGGSNPLRTLRESGSYRDETNTFIGAITATLKPMKGLSIEGQISYKNRDRIITEFRNEIPALINFFTGAPISGTAVTPNSYRESWYKNGIFMGQVYATYENSFKDHYFKVMAGTSYEDNRNREIYGQRRDLPLNGMEAFGSSGALMNGDNVFLGGLPESDAFQSAFSRLNYSYKDKYYLEGIFRADATSRFSANNRWGYFPTVMASWRIDKEKFMSNVKFVNDLKLRASVGESGNVYNVGYWDFLSLYRQGNAAVLDGSIVPGVWPSKIPNPDLKWETTLSKNIGLDGTLFNRKLTFQLDLFDRLTKDILNVVPVPYEFGVGPSRSAEYPSVNTARVQNKGVEINLGYQNNGDQFQYYINANFSKIWNKVVNLNNPLITSPFILRQGDAVGSFYGFEAIGLYSQQDVINNYPTLSANTRPGDIKIKDQNGDGKIDENDRIVLGNDVPYLTFGLNGGFGYKNFDFNFVMQGVSNVKVYLSNEASQAFFNGAGAKEYVLGRWTPENPDPNAVYPRILETADNQQNDASRTISSFWLFNADYIRVKALTLGYSLPDEMSKSIGLTRFRIYFTANNLFTIRGDKRMKDFDPEMASSRATYPQTKTVAFGVNVQF